MGRVGVGAESRVIVASESGPMRAQAQFVPETDPEKIGRGFGHAGTTSVAEHRLPFDLPHAYTAYTVAEPKMGRRTGPAVIIRDNDAYETQVLTFDDSDEGRLARALDGDENAEVVELEWHQERSVPFWNNDGSVPWDGELTDDVPEGDGVWKKPRKPVLAQMEPVHRVRKAAGRARISLSIQQGCIVDAVGVPEYAHRPQRFQRRRGHFFMDHETMGKGLGEALPLPVQAPPATAPRSLPPCEGDADVE